MHNTKKNAGVAEAKLHAACWDSDTVWAPAHVSTWSPLLVSQFVEID